MNCTVYDAVQMQSLRTTVALGKMYNNIEIKEEFQCQNGASAAIKSESEDPLALYTESQNEMYAVQSVDETKTVAPNKIELNGESWSQTGLSVAIKTEPISDAGVHNETVYAPLSKTVIYHDEKTDVKLEVKEEPWWHDVRSKSENDSDCNIDIEMKLSALDTKEVLGDFPGVVPRLSTELTCRNSDNTARRKNSDLELENSDPKISDFLNPSEDTNINSIMSSDVETGSWIHNDNNNQLLHLEMYTASHKDKQVHKCKICGASFVYVSDLKRHQLIHEDKEEKNEMCQKSFIPASNLEQHKLINERQRKHKCDICEKSFTRSSGLKKHKLIHEGIRPFKCEVCKKSFTDTSTLKAHRLNHEGKKPHKCDVCGKTFTSSSNLKIHKLVHEGKRPYKCEVCEKTFVYAATYKTHKLIHDSKRPYTCNICMKNFKRSSHLKKHCTLIHEGKRPYTCSVCEKSFQQSSHLNQHYTAKHESKRSYACEICAKSYKRAAHLRRHTLLVHQKALTETILEINS